MAFKVVEIPEGSRSQSSEIVDALVANVGKAVEVGLEGKDANTYRKQVRSIVASRNLLRTHTYKTRYVANGDALVIWLEPKDPIVTAPIKINTDPEGQKQ